MKTAFDFVVRSQRDLKGFGDAENGGYVDEKTGEVSFPPSVVDSSNYESLADLVKKLLRGGEVSMNSRSVLFEVEAGADPMEAISNFDETRREGFDLADVAAIATRLKEVAEQSVEARKAKLAEDKAKLEQDEKDLKAFRAKASALERLGETKSSEHTEAKPK